MAVNTKKFPFKPKKIPYYLLVTLLTLGASLILGFLSFGGMYALFPVLSLSFAAFGLSVAYEGEIYLQNIKGSFKKLFKSSYLENHLAKEYLLAHFPENTQDENCQQFFRDYEEHLKLLSAFKHKHLDKESKKRKKQIEKTLTDMEKWFALQLFATKESNNGQSDYTGALRIWLAEHEQDKWQKELNKRKTTFNFVKAFSVLSAAFMGLGSTYLIVEAFSVIPFFAAIPFAFWPLIIVPMAIIAGAAYGMLTYNAITDLINNDTINKWYTKIHDDLSQGLTPRNVFLATMAVLLTTVAVLLTFCTAGTWWTIATNARPLFEWMRRMPSFIMGVINPLFTGLSTIFFNIENIAESLEMVDEASRADTNIFQRTYESITEGCSHIRATENWWQILNPFRIILKLTVTPLRILLFLGHLVSIALTSDRVPGVPQILSLLIAIISEGFEDAHYFVGKAGHPNKDGNEEIKRLLEEHLGDEGGHELDTDIPTRILKVLTLPLYALAAAWDWLASNGNHHSEENPQRRVLTFAQAWNKQQGIPEEEEVLNAKPSSKEWQIEHSISLIEKHERKHLNDVWGGSELADEKRKSLKQLKDKVRSVKDDSLPEILEQEKLNPVYNQHRLFALQKDEVTTSQAFIDELPIRVGARR
ncbi:MAG: hypothetical protein ACRCXC_05005 [Legionella sp.]